MESSICILRGQIYEAMENWVLATENYREALRRDVYCFEGFELLMKRQMLTAEEGMNWTLSSVNYQLEFRSEKSFESEHF